MGEVEISINEEGALKVVQHCDLRAYLRRLQQDGFWRPRVVKWPNYEFNRVLLILFLITVCLGLIHLLIVEQLLTHKRRPDELSTWNNIFNHTWLFGHFQIGRNGIVLLAMFAAILAVGVVAKEPMKNPGSARRRGEQVQTVAALVQVV